MRLEACRARQGRLGQPPRPASLGQALGKPGRFPSLIVQAGEGGGVHQLLQAQVQALATALGLRHHARGQPGTPLDLTERGRGHAGPCRQGLVGQAQRLAALAQACADPRGGLAARPKRRAVLIPQQFLLAQLQRVGQLRDHFLRGAAPPGFNGLDVGGGDARPAGHRRLAQLQRLPLGAQGSRASSVRDRRSSARRWMRQAARSADGSGCLGVSMHDLQGAITLPHQHTAA